MSRGESPAKRRGVPVGATLVRIIAADYQVWPQVAERLLPRAGKVPLQVSLWIVEQANIGFSAYAAQHRCERMQRQMQHPVCLLYMTFNPIDNKLSKRLVVSCDKLLPFPFGQLASVLGKPTRVPRRPIQFDEQARHIATDAVIGQ